MTRLQVRGMKRLDGASRAFIVERSEADDYTGAPMFRTSATLLALTFLAACGSTTDGTSSTPAPAPGAQGNQPATADQADAGPEVDHGAPSDVYPAPHPDPPQVVSAGGSVLKTPRIVPIFFKGDAMKAQVVEFAGKIGATPFWSANTTEYGVGAASAGDAVEIDETPAATLSDADVALYMRSLFDGKHGLGTEPDPNTIYTIYYPHTTTIELSGGMSGSETSCDAFGGYHDSTTTADFKKTIVYAVIPECPDFGGLSGIDAITATSSHEWLEAVTDPNPTTDPAFATVDDDHAVWSFFLGGSETGDMCAQDPTSFYIPKELGVAVQRSWSNAAAKAGHDPCVPAIDNGPYFNAAPVLPDTIKLSSGRGGDAVATKGIKIPVGESRTIEVDLFSDGPTNGPWQVKARSLDFSNTKTLDLTLDRQSGQNGEKLYLTIKALAASPYKASAFMINSRLGERRTRWVGMVAN